MANDTDEIVVVAAKRTPMGAFLGALASVSATDLGAAAINALLTDSDIAPDLVDEVFMGCVLPAGLGQAPARQAALKGGLAQASACTTVNKVCGSGMKAVMLGHDLIRAGSAKVVVAGGMESMSRAPYLLQNTRQGVRFGHQQTLDHMFFDGLENAEDNALMGIFAERCVDQYQFTRQAQDAYAIESVKRAQHAVESGVFNNELTPVSFKQRRDEVTVDADEQPFKCNIDKIPTLKPAFRQEGGSVTAANSSSISDGAAALLIMDAPTAARHNLTPLAKITAHATHAQAPEDFTTAPIGAIHKLLTNVNWLVDDVELFEINEAFAVVAMAAINDLELDPAKVNINGGACALGHPIGASGARILVTLIHALHQRNLTKGVASLCIGGGEATAVAIERIA